MPPHQRSKRTASLSPPEQTTFEPYYNENRRQALAARRLHAPGGEKLPLTLKHLVNTVRGLSDRNIGLCVLTGQGANIDTTTASGKLIFGIFAALAEFEGDLIRERTMAGLAAARARGRHGGRKFELTKNQIRLAQSAMANRDTHVAQLCRELDISRATLYRYVGPDGALRSHALKALEA